jgi:predicted nuclease with TOPRIM domain
MNQNENQEIIKLLLELQKQLLNSNNQINEISSELSGIKEGMSKPASSSQISKEWMTREETKKWLGFGDTQFAAITKQYKLVYSTIGRKRLYHIPSLGDTLNKNKIN